MKHLLGLAFLALAMLPTWASASPASFTALENRLSERLAAYDARAVDALWDDAFVFVSPGGRVSHKAQRLAGLKPPAAQVGQPLTSHNDEVSVAYEDEHMAVVIVRSTWRLGDVVQGDPYMATHVWVRRDGGWRLISAQVAQIGK